MTFQNHIFISYAHADNERSTTDGVDAGWITELHEYLRIRLHKLLGEKPTIWRDIELRGADRFDDEIRDQLVVTALLLVILSPRYIKSDYCRMELREFARHADANRVPNLGNRSRIFKVIKTPVDRGLHPAEIADQLGYEFFVFDEISKHFDEFDSIFGEERKQRFYLKAEELAQDIKLWLELMMPSADDAPAEPDKPLVYLAQTTSDLAHVRDQIARELKQRHYTVLPDTPLSLVVPALEDELRGYMERADLSIHILGERYGIVPEGTTQSLHQIELEIATARSSVNGLKRIIWLPPDAAPSDDNQRAFVDSVTTTSTYLHHADLLRDTVEGFVTIVLDRLKQIESDRQREREQSTEAPSPEAEVVRIYLVYDHADADTITALIDFLDAREFEVLRPAFTGEPETLIQVHREHLRTCDAVLLYCGTGSDSWLYSKQQDLRKAMGLGRQQPLRAIAIALAAPATPDKQNFRTREATMLDLTTGAPLDTALQPFLSQLES